MVLDVFIVYNIIYFFEKSTEEMREFKDKVIFSKIPQHIKFPLLFNVAFEEIRYLDFEMFENPNESLSYLIITDDNLANLTNIKVDFSKFIPKKITKNPPRLRYDNQQPIIISIKEFKKHIELFNKLVFLEYENNLNDPKFIPNFGSILNEIANRKSN